MIAYCENKLECRRELVLAYFGESFAKENCNQTCDNCKNNLSADFVDISGHVKNLIEIIQELGESNVTINQCIDIYRGSKSGKILDQGHDSLNAYGKGIIIDTSGTKWDFIRKGSQKD